MFVDQSLTVHVFSREIVTKLKYKRLYHDEKDALYEVLLCRIETQKAVISVKSCGRKIRGKTCACHEWKVLWNSGKRALSFSLSLSLSLSRVCVFTSVSHTQKFCLEMRDDEIARENLRRRLVPATFANLTKPDRRHPL